MEHIKHLIKQKITVSEDERKAFFSQEISRKLKRQEVLNHPYRVLTCRKQLKAEL
jgi:hypothetical protein